ncbi:enoyl-CoA hydratase [Oceanobacillus profundus]|uniref:enoyl-CoA hydratase n=1 Tax=Oceanobacillus profundus TaxID=372463 RepID=UPI0036400F1A
MTMIMYEVEGNVAYLTIKSPPANALSRGLLKDLSEQLNRIEQENRVKAVVLKGDGRFFSAGADIKEFTDLQNASDYASLATNGQRVFSRMEQFPVPIIAAIYGAALGGGLELAMACHIRIVTENTKLGLPEVNLGIIPGFAGTQRLPRYVGAAKAYEMILTGEPISGSQAAAWGLANSVVAEEELLSEATKLANKIAAKSKPAIQHIMHLVSVAKTEAFSKGEEEEANAFSQVFGNEDAREGIQAFLEKRQADFKDK